MGKKAPKAPDPAATAAAQGAWNSFTAQQQQALNMTNQVSPWGTLNYDATGTQTIIDPNGKEVVVPRYTATTSLTPEQQAIFDQTQQADLNLATIAQEQSGKIGELLNNPFEFNNSDAEQWAYDLASPRILQQQGKNEAALRSQLISSGIRPGTAAWDSEMSRLTNANTDQLNQLALTGRSQAFSEALAQRNQPLNEIIGLTSGTQIQNPTATFANSPQTQVGGVDYTGLVNQQYNAQMQQYNSQMGALGGLFGLAGKAIFSDRRLKKDIIEAGTVNSKPWYGFRYLWDNENSPLRFGFMAQDLLKLLPEAVSIDKSGFYKVDMDLAMEAI